MTENLIIFNARVVTPIGFSARCGKEMGELCIIDNATIEVTDGIISYVGPSRGEMRGAVSASGIGNSHPNSNIDPTEDTRRG